MALTVQEIWTAIRTLSTEERQQLLIWLLAEQRAVTSQEAWDALMQDNNPTTPTKGEGEFEERERIL